MSSGLVFSRDTWYKGRWWSEDSYHCFFEPQWTWLWLQTLGWKLMVHWLKLLPCQYRAFNFSVINSKSSWISNINREKAAVWEPLGCGFFRMHLELKTSASCSHHYCHPVFSGRWLNWKAIDNVATCTSAPEYQGPLDKPTAMPGALHLQATCSLQYGEDCH